MLDGASVANINPKGPYKTLARPCLPWAALDLQQLETAIAPQLHISLASGPPAACAQPAVMLKLRVCRRTSSGTGN